MKRKLICFAVIIMSVCFAFTGCKSSKAKSEKPTAEPKSEEDETDYYFSQDKGNPDKELIEVINGSKKSLDIAIYDITKVDIIDAIISAQKRGVHIRLVVDREQAVTKFESSAIARIKSAKVPVKINTHRGCMHLKITIADGKIVTTGSYDYTGTATKENDEVLVVIHSEKSAQQFEKEFNRMWNDEKNFKQL